MIEYLGSSVGLVRNFASSWTAYKKRADGTTNVDIDIDGLSGTGPKAGGPRYPHRFAHERTLTINTSAVGGNASLLAME